VPFNGRQHTNEITFAFPIVASLLFASLQGAVKQIVRNNNGLAKMLSDVSIPPLLADVLHKALNVGGGRLGAVGTLGRIWWMLIRRATHNVGVTIRLIDANARLPGSAVVTE
jgi:hypothetical protein